MVHRYWIEDGFLRHRSVAGPGGHPEEIGREDRIPLRNDETLEELIALLRGELERRREASLHDSFLSRVMAATDDKFSTKN